jgi:hypothetical protein
MESKYEFDPKQLASLKTAIRRNPRKILLETGNFLVRGIREYNTYIMRAPWRVGGGGGGGAPVATGNLRDTHARKILPWEGSIYPTARYAKYVHGIKGFPRKRSYQLRPWLDFAQHAASGAIYSLQRKLLENITKDLAQ